MFKRSMLVRLVLLIGSCLTWETTFATATTESFQIIANDSVHSVSLTRDQVSRMFLKKLASWPDGQVVIPVDQERSAAIRRSFSSSIHGRSGSALASYWQQQIFSGGDVPPAEKSGDAEVLAFVRATPGAIGYVSAGAALGDGVKVITVK